MSFASYIRKLAKDRVDCGINADGVEFLDSLADKMITKFVTATNGVAGKRKTVSVEFVDAAVGIIFAGTDLLPRAQKSVKMAVKNYEKAMLDVDPDNRTNLADKAGLIISPARVKSVFLQSSALERMAGAVPIMIAAALEYVLTEVISVAHECTMADEKVRISYNHLATCVNKDKEISAVVGCISVE